MNVREGDTALVIGPCRLAGKVVGVLHELRVIEKFGLVWNVRTDVADVPVPDRWLMKIARSASPGPDIDIDIDFDL